MAGVASASDGQSPRPTFLNEAENQAAAIVSDVERSSGNSKGDSLSHDTPNATAAVEITLLLTQPDGSQLTVLSPGQDFVLHVYVKDLRNAPQGVFAGYLDITWNESLAVVAGPIQYDSAYGNSRLGDVSRPGLIDEAGAFSGLSPLGAGNRELFSLRLRACTPGELTFAADPADRRPWHDVLVYGWNKPVSPEFILYGLSTITISAQLSNDAVARSADQFLDLDYVRVREDLAEGEGAPATIQVGNAAAVLASGRPASPGIAALTPHTDLSELIEAPVASVRTNVPFDAQPRMFGNDQPSLKTSAAVPVPSQDSIAAFDEHFAELGLARKTSRVLLHSDSFDSLLDSPLSQWGQVRIRSCGPSQCSWKRWPAIDPGNSAR